MSKVHNVRRRQAVRFIRRMDTLSQRYPYYGHFTFPPSTTARVMANTSGRLWRARTTQNRLAEKKRRRLPPTPEMVESWKLLDFEVQE